MQYLFAFVLICLTVVIHALGTMHVIAHLFKIWQRKVTKPGPLVSVFQIIRVVGALLFLHLLEAGAWAIFYLMAKLLPDINTAVYFSLTSYTTVGYGDVVLPDAWRILGPIEASVGILMFGWSTAIIVTAITRINESRSTQADL